VGVGVQKAGTSWWFELLLAHPNVHPPAGAKEIHFFQGMWNRPCTDADIARYHRYFARPEGKVCGEWTPRYMYDFWVPPLLARATPGGRVLVLLRDPVDRYLSGLAHDLSRGAPEHPVVAADAFARGLYGAQLARLFRFVAPERVLVLQFERCRRDPAGELARTQRFLELDAHPLPEDGARPVNATQVPKPELPPAVRAALVDAYRQDADLLSTLVPALDLDLWPSLGP
jgi:hypothetical protein